ncbi:MAG TPA: hypothetical protein VGO52_21035 [Hyphomonadaceae bacterium]|jgi:hypothetical protein|nr:hypothetical protein [Hyphomonadaceae bacterium]
MADAPQNAKPADNWLKSSNMPRLGFATALAPPAAGALLAIILGLTVFNAQIFLAPDPADPNLMKGASIPLIAGNLFNAVTGGIILGALVGWPVMLVFGLPGHALLLRKTSARLWIYGAAGIVIGLAGGAFRYFQSRSHSANDLTQFLAIGAVTGTLAAIIFWFARRPDKDAAEYKS